MSNLETIHPWQRQIDKVHLSLGALRELDVIRLVPDGPSKQHRIIDPAVIDKLEALVGPATASEMGIHWAAVINLAMETPLLSLEPMGDDDYVIVVDQAGLVGEDERAWLLSAMYFRVPIDVHAAIAVVVGLRPDLALRPGDLPGYQRALEKVLDAEGTGPVPNVSFGVNGTPERYAEKIHEIMLKVFTDDRSMFEVSELMLKLFEVGVRRGAITSTKLDTPNSLLGFTSRDMAPHEVGKEVITEARDAVKALLFGVLYPCGVCRAPDNAPQYDIEVDQDTFQKTLEVLRYRLRLPTSPDVLELE